MLTKDGKLIAQEKSAFHLSNRSTMTSYAFTSWRRDIAVLDSSTFKGYDELKQNIWLIIRNCHSSTAGCGQRDSSPANIAEASGFLP